jgi:DNA-binding LacI/PurR family transcriptional regulator
VRVTLQTLAEDLGVSRATVSNAYNRPDQLSPSLRERILERAAQLGFAGPDPVARGLRRGRVGAIGVVVDQSLSYAFSDPVAVLVLDGLARELQQEGYGLLLHAAAPDQVDAAAVRAAAVDGWVVLSVPRGHPAVLAATASGRPLVVLDQPGMPGVATVTVDDADGARQAAAHLVELGHTRVTVLTPPLRGDATGGFADDARLAVTTHEVMARRLAAARPVLGGPAADAVPVVECAANGEDAGAAGAALALDAPQPPTALLALSDQLALGALRLARDRGLEVPRELSVAGFDDAPPARRASPPLTTVAQPLRERGAQLGQLLRAQLAGEPVDPPPPSPVRLVVRGSTGPAPPGPA